MISSFILLLIFTIISPLEFLNNLCDNRSGTEGAQYWADHASVNVDISTDELTALLSEMRDLSFDPGAQITETNTDDGLRIINYTGSVWTWTDNDGNICRSIGLTALSYEADNFCWIEIPFIRSGTASSEGPGMFSGLIGTIGILFAAILILIWAKRKYRT